MFRWLLVALAGYIIYRMYRNDIKAKLAQRKDDEARRQESGEMVRDPICGTFVDLTEAITVRDGDKLYYFCGYDCRDAFLKRMQSGESSESIAAGAGQSRSTQPKNDNTPPSDTPPADNAP